MKSITTLLLGFAVFAMMAFQNHNANDSIKGTWMPSDKRSKIEIYKGTIGASKGKFYGKVTWLIEPTRDGKARVDENNPDKAKRTKPLMGLLILKNFTWDSDDKEYKGGTIYDPKNGKTYSCYMKFDGNDKLDVRGYIGISLIGRTDTWTRVKRKE